MAGIHTFVSLHCNGTVVVVVVIVVVVVTGNALFVLDEGQLLITLIEEYDIAVEEGADIKEVSVPFELEVLFVMMLEVLDWYSSELIWLLEGGEKLVE